MIWRTYLDGEPGGPAVSTDDLLAQHAAPLALKLPPPATSRNILDLPPDAGLPRMDVDPVAVITEMRRRLEEVYDRRWRR